MPRDPRRQSTSLSVERVQRSIMVIRGQRVLLDSDLAGLYVVELRALLQAVRRNRDRFPSDFVFRLSRDEWTAPRSQTVILDTGRGRHRKYLPYVFTEQGVAMLSSVLRSARAVMVNVAIMRAFVQLRRLIESDAALARRLAALERRMIEHDRRFAVVFDAIRRVLDPQPPARRHRIGFRRTERSTRRTPRPSGRRRR